MTDEEIDILYGENPLRLSNNEEVLNTLWFINRLILVGEVVTGTDKCVREKLTAADGTEYLEYTKRRTKTRTGAEPRNKRLVKLKAFTVPRKSHHRDPEAVYEAYCQKRPHFMVFSKCYFITTFIAKTLSELVLGHRSHSKRDFLKWPPDPL